MAKTLRDKLAGLFQVVPNALQSAGSIVNRGLNADLSSRPGTQSINSAYQSWKQKPSNVVGNQIFGNIPTTPAKQMAVNADLQTLLGRNTIPTTVAQGANNWFTAPLFQIPYRLQEATKARQSGKKMDYGMNMLQAVGGLIPGADDLAVAGYTGVKSALNKQGFASGVSGNQFPGLGDVAQTRLGVSPGVATALNVAELPLMILAGGKIKAKIKGGGSELKAIGEADEAAKLLKESQSTVGGVKPRPLDADALADIDSFIDRVNPKLASDMFQQKAKVLNATYPENIAEGRKLVELQKQALAEIDVYLAKRTSTQPPLPQSTVGGMDPRQFKTADEFVGAYENKVKSEYSNKFNEAQTRLKDVPKVIQKNLTEKSAEIYKKIHKGVEVVDAGGGRFNIVEGTRKQTFLGMTPSERELFYKNNPDLFKNKILTYEPGENGGIYSNSPNVNKAQLTEIWNKANLPQPPKPQSTVGIDEIKTKPKTNTQSFSKQEADYAKLQSRVGDIGLKFQKNLKKVSPEKEFKKASIKTEQSMRNLYKKFVRNTESFNAPETEVPTGGIKMKSPLRQGAESFILTTRGIVRRMGNPGKYAVAKMDEYVDLAQNKGGNWLADYKNAVRGVSDDSLKRIFNAQRGEAVELTAKEASVQKEIARILEQVSQEAQDAGLTIKRADGDIPFTPRENYFPQFLDRDKLKANPQLVIDHLVSTGQMNPENATAFVDDVVRGLTVRDAYFARNFPGTIKRYGNLEYSRILDLPKEVLRDDKAVLSDYLNSSSQRIARANIFGPSDEAVEPIVREVGKSGGNMQTVQEFFDRNFGIIPSTPSDVIAGKIRGFQSAVKLPLFALSNSAQSVNTATTAGIGRTFKTIANFFANSGARTEMVDYTTRTGELNSSILRDFSRDVNSGSQSLLAKLTGPFGQKVESFNRIIATNTGKKYAEDMAKRLLANPNDKTALKAFAKLDLNPQTVLKQGGLSDGDLIKAGQSLADLTQFKVNQSDLPPQFSTTWGKVLFQYKQFAYKQGEFLLNEVAKEAAKGNLQPLSRYLIIGGLVGLPLAEIKRRIYGRERPDTPQGVYLEALSSVGGAGIIQDMIYASQGGQKMINFILGPTGGDAVKLASAIDTAKKTGDYTDLARFGVSYIPLVGGVASRRLFPYDSQKYKVGQSIVPAKTPEGIKSQKSQITKKIEAGKKVSPAELEFYYLYDADKMTAGNNYEKALKMNEYYKVANTILDSDLTTEQKQGLLNSIATKGNFSIGDLAYNRIATQDVDARTGFMVDRLNEATDPTDRMRKLISARNIVNGKMILQSSVIKNLEDMGLITPDEANLLNDVYLKEGKPTQSAINKIKAKKGKKIAVKKMPKGKKIQVGVGRQKIKLPKLKKAKYVKTKPPKVNIKVKI